MNHHSNHSHRRATIGSTFVARRAGSQQANKATSAKSDAIKAKVDGSVALTSNSRLLISRVSPAEATSPSVRLNGGFPTIVRRAGLCSAKSVSVLVERLSYDSTARYQSVAKKDCTASNEIARLPNEHALYAPLKPSFPP